MLFRSIVDKPETVASPERDEVQNSTLMEIIVSPDTKIFGPIAQKYLPTVKDDKLGLYWVKKNSFRPMIVNFILRVDRNDIIIDTEN